MLELIAGELGNLICIILSVSSPDQFPSPLGAEKEKEMLERYKNGDEEARQALIKHNLRLVAHIIKKYYSGYSEQDDLISIGTIGLIKGINSFNPDKGTRLATYTARCIENEILMHFRNQRKSANDVSISEPIEVDKQGNSLTLIDIISVDDTIVEDIALSQKIEKLRSCISEIDEKRDLDIIVGRYGLDGSEPLTQRELADKLGISRSYVSRIEKRIIGDLRHKLKDD